MSCKKIGFIGSGKMASAIIKGLIKTEYAKPENLLATPGGQEVLNRRRAKGRHQIAVTGSKRA